MGHLNGERYLFWQKLIGNNDAHCGSEFSQCWFGQIMVDFQGFWLNLDRCEERAIWMQSRLAE